MLHVAVLTGRSTGSGFDLARFSSLSSERLCIFVLHGVKIYNPRQQKYYFCYIFSLPFAELSLVGLALDLVD